MAPLLLTLALATPAAPLLVVGVSRLFARLL